jgi:ssDNA-specific exonuclease RecJ
MSISLKQNPDRKIRKSKRNSIQFPCQPTSPELAMEISSELAMAAIYRKSYSCHTKPLSGNANREAFEQLRLVVF